MSEKDPYTEKRKNQSSENRNPTNLNDTTTGNNQRPGDQMGSGGSQSRDSIMDNSRKESDSGSSTQNNRKNDKTQGNTQDGA